jgi:hypothetical protein
MVCFLCVEVKCLNKAIITKLVFPQREII